MGITQYGVEEGTDIKRNFQDEKNFVGLYAKPYTQKSLSLDVFSLRCSYITCEVKEG